MTYETQDIEWKASWRDEYLKWICGFANAQGGILEIGRNDRGEVIGVNDVHRLLAEIPNKVLSLLGIVVEVNLKSESGLEYLEILVEPHPNPISYRGRFHYRSGSTKQVLEGPALTRLLLQKHGRTWDDVPLPGIDPKSLDGRVVADFRRRGAESERLPREILGESDEAVLEKLQLREAGFLKRAAVLLFHPAPHRFIMEAFLKIGYFRGSELLFQDVVEGDLFTQVDQTMDLLYTKYTRALISYDGIYRVETFPVPREAMREAVINAVIHRDYASPTTIQIRVYDDRVAIWNAAHLAPEWLTDQLAEEFSSRPHNPRVAYAFFRAGMIEAWGRGIQRIMDICREVGNPTPTWRLEAGGSGLWIKFPFSAAYQAADSTARGIAIQETTQKTTQKTTRDRILDYLRAEPGLTQRVLAERVGLTPDGVRYHLRKLKAAGALRRVGSDRAGSWEVLW
ncbi:MAG: winged helix-turn-helix transcriptional regulator [Caldilineaceae bacterium]|nr:winged helix-turn-helix transcriptional regulator [Caldilineaceae bacterium]